MLLRLLQQQFCIAQSDFLFSGLLCTIWQQAFEKVAEIIILVFCHFLSVCYSYYNSEMLSPLYGFFYHSYQGLPLT